MKKRDRHIKNANKERQLKQGIRVYTCLIGCEKKRLKITWSERDKLC